VNEFAFDPTSVIVYRVFRVKCWMESTANMLEDIVTLDSDVVPNPKPNLILFSGYL